MQDLLVFNPIPAAGRSGEVDVTSTAATTTLGQPGENVPDRIRVVNHGNVKARFLLAGKSDPNTWVQADVTDTTGLVLMPGVIEEFSLRGAPSFSLKTESGTTDVNWQLGSGV